MNNELIVLNDLSLVHDFAFFSLYNCTIIHNINVCIYIYVYIIFHQPPSFQCSRLPAKRERRSPSCQEKARPVGSVVFLPAYFHQKTAQGLRDICNILLNVLYIVLEYISTS